MAGAMMSSAAPHDAAAGQRQAQARARRTAWVLAGVALTVYLGFLASAVFAP